MTDERIEEIRAGVRDERAMCESLMHLGSEQWGPTTAESVRIAQCYLSDIEYLLSLVPRWIPVTERLPEPDEWYVGLIVLEEVDFKRLDRVRVLRLLRGYPGTPTGEATHWMPLPKPPSERGMI